MTEPQPTATETGLRARLRDRRQRRRNSSGPARRLLARLRLYGPVMRTLHRHGQCWMDTHPAPDGGQRRHCTWCGHDCPVPDRAAEQARAIAELNALAWEARET